jgi:hypothetical protein
MAWRAIGLTAALAVAGCSASPSSLGITGPGTSAPLTFKDTPPVDDDAAVGLPGLQDNQGTYSPTYKPAGDAAKPGNFFGYN